MRQKASGRGLVIPFLKMVTVAAVGGLVCFAMAVGVAVAESSSSHEKHGMEASQSTKQGLKPQSCRLSHGGMAPTDRMPSEQPSSPNAALLEGLQVETSDITLYELFFETVLQADPVFRIDHPQVDHLRAIVIGMSRSSFARI